MKIKHSKREQVELILLAFKCGDFTADMAADKLIDLLDRKSELRDKFATAALQGIIASSGNESIPSGLDFQKSAMSDAKTAYQFADAMLIARAA